MSFPSRSRNYSPGAEPPETPYLRARRERADQISAAIAQARNWRLSAWALSALLAGAIAWIGYLGAQLKTVPYVIEVDRLGSIQNHGPLGAEMERPSQPLIGAQLRRFIEDVRTLSSDQLVMKRAWTRVFQMLTPQARARMTEWATVNNPIERADTESAAITILSATPVSDKTWQIDWREQRWDRSGAAIGVPTVWRAMLTTQITAPSSNDEMAQNPLGLFVDEFHWDRVLTSRSKTQRRDNP